MDKMGQIQSSRGELGDDISVSEENLEEEEENLSGIET